MINSDTARLPSLFDAAGESCRGCSTEKPLDDFYVTSAGKVRHPCKACLSQRHRDRYTPKHGTDDAARNCRACGTTYQPKTRRVSYYCSRECLHASRAPKLRDQWLREKYGIGEAEYDALLREQGGGCAICGAEPGGVGKYGVLHVDHDHKTGRVRGILCQPCNHGLGHFFDDPSRLAGAIEYLRTADGPN